MADEFNLLFGGFTVQRTAFAAWTKLPGDKLLVRTFLQLCAGVILRR
jgi:hypothetical protein